MTDKKTVPLATLIEERKKFKEDTEKLKATIESLTTQVNEIKTRSESEGLWMGIKPTTDEEVNVRQRLMEIEKKLRDKESELTKKEKDFAAKSQDFDTKYKDYESRERLTRVKDKATRLGIPEQELLEAVEGGEPETDAIVRLVSEKRSLSPGGFDRTTPEKSATPSVLTMPTDDFNKHWDAKVREAAIRK